MISEYTGGKKKREPGPSLSIEQLNRLNRIPDKDDSEGEYDKVVGRAALNLLHLGDARTNGSEARKTSRGRRETFASCRHKRHV